MQGRDPVTPKFMLIQGITVNKHFYSILIFLTMVAYLLMSFLSTFTGFVIGFADNEDRKFTPYFLKGISIFLFGATFGIRCLMKRSYEGHDLKYIFEIIKQYWKEGRFLVDLITFAYSIVFICIPTSEVVGGIYFFLLLVPMFISFKDVIMLETLYLRTKKQKLLIGLLKVFFLNFFFAHFNATVLLGMARIDLPNSWLAVNGHL